MKKITCFALSALAGALGMYAYREFQAARELKALQGLEPCTLKNMTPEANAEARQRLNDLGVIPADAKVMALQTMPVGVRPMWQGLTASEVNDIVQRLLGKDASTFGKAPDDKSREPN